MIEFTPPIGDVVSEKIIVLLLYPDHILTKMVMIWSRCGWHIILILQDISMS